MHTQHISHKQRKSFTWNITHTKHSPVTSLVPRETPSNTTQITTTHQTFTLNRTHPTSQPKTYHQSITSSPQPRLSPTPIFFTFHVKHSFKSHVSRGTSRNHRTSLIFSFIFNGLDCFTCYLFAIFFMLDIR